MPIINYVFEMCKNVKTNETTTTIRISNQI